jgi:putative FmdB family regulatory protein
MPKYSYHCKECGSLYEIWHGMTEEHTNCTVCNEPSVVRIPSLLGEVLVASPQKVGDIVNKTIEDTKEEVKEFKKELSKEIDK